MPEEYFTLLEYLDQTPITYEEIVLWTRKDTVLVQALFNIQLGWPDKCPDSDE